MRHFHRSGWDWVPAQNLAGQSLCEGCASTGWVGQRAKLTGLKCPRVQAGVGLPPLGPGPQAWIRHLGPGTATLRHGSQAGHWGISGASVRGHWDRHPGTREGFLHDDYRDPLQADRRVASETGGGGGGCWRIVLFTGPRGGPALTVFTGRFRVPPLTPRIHGPRHNQT